MRKKSKIKGLCIAAVIAAIYTALTIMPGLNLLAYGAVQFRVSEVLTVLPVFTPWAIPGLTIGCLISNILSTAGPLDMLFGTIASFLAAISTYFLRKMPEIIAVIPAALFNGIIVGFMITYFYMEIKEKFVLLLLYNMASVAFGELVVCCFLGIPLMKYIEKHNRIFESLR